MEFLIELVLELALEGGIEASKNKKIPRIIRYLIISIIVLFFATIILGLFVIGILMLKESVAFGIFMILISIILFISSIIKFKKVYLEKIDTIE